MKGLIFFLLFGLAECSILNGQVTCDSKGPFDRNCLLPIPDVTDVLIAFSNAWTKMDYHHKVILTMLLGKECKPRFLDDVILVALTDAIITHPEKHHDALKFFESLK